METKFNNEKRYLLAQKKVTAIKKFYSHLFWYLVVNTYLLTATYLNLDVNENFFQYHHFTTVFFWGIGIVFHWFAVFGKNTFFSKDWEKKKIEKYMQQDANL